VGYSETPKDPAIEWLDTCCLFMGWRYSDDVLRIVARECDLSRIPRSAVERVIQSIVGAERKPSPREIAHRLQGWMHEQSGESKGCQLCGNTPGWLSYEVQRDAGGMHHLASPDDPSPRYHCATYCMCPMGVRLAQAQGAGVSDERQAVYDRLKKRAEESDGAPAGLALNAFDLLDTKMQRSVEADVRENATDLERKAFHYYPALLRFKAAFRAQQLRETGALEG
jgi:hypothetical protein